MSDSELLLLPVYHILPVETQRVSMRSTRSWAGDHVKSVPSTCRAATTAGCRVNSESNSKMHHTSKYDVTVIAQIHSICGHCSDTEL